MTSLSQVELFPAVGEAIEIFRGLGFKIFLITNQAIVARGLLSYQDTLKLNQDILSLVKAQNQAAFFDDVYLCPHHPRATVVEYRIDCECRKPKSGMILEAKKQYDIDLSQSIVIGDRPSDIYAGKNVGCHAYQLKTGEHEAPLIESELKLDNKFLVPDMTFNSLIEVAYYLQGKT